MKALLQTIPRTELAAVIQEFYKRASPETRATVEEVFGVEAQRVVPLALNDAHGG